MAKKNEFEHTPKYQIGQPVLSLEYRDYGIIKIIDNKCSKLFDEKYDNPGHLEYYVEWKGGAWTRHYCFEIDEVKDRNFIVITPAVRVLYSGNKLAKQGKV